MTERCVDKQYVALQKRVVWWRKAWRIGVEDGPDLPTTGKRRRAVPAATRALEETGRRDESSAARKQRSRKHVPS